MTELTDRNLPDSVARVDRLLAEAGAPNRVRLLERSARTAAEAAAALGCEVGAIASSLVFDADGDPLLVVTSGAHRVDTTRVAVLVGARKVRRASPDLVRQATGFAIGGVAPVGHPAPVRTLVDATLGRYPTVWAAAGHPHAVFATTFDELCALTGGRPAEVAEPSPSP